MFGENKASTFNKNLEKMIALVLFDKYNCGLTIADIITDIRNKYALDFSDAEILGAIRRKNQNRIIQIDEARDEALKKYSITPEEHEKIEKKTDDTSIREMAILFLKTYERINISEEEFCDLLIRYLYDIFNSNADTIRALMNGDDSGIRPVNYEYTIDEKEVINEFIYWENPDKNRCVYRLISCCFDYCMMTVHKDKSVYKTIFNQKKFYLDTNIVFRLMGLNNEKRKLVIDAFVLKCKEVGIQILYSNHTRRELNDTINYYVGQIKNLLSGSAPISVQAMSCLNDRMSSSAFYAQYVEWTKNPVNKIGDYGSFANDLKRKAAESLSQFRQVTFDDYSSRRTKEFGEQFDSLKRYKIDHKRNIYDSSIKADVNNYLYIQERNKEKKADDFFSTDHYLITADHAFAGWEREKRPGAIPTVVLPSVWYSIILQYAGRTTEDDYSAFTRFLNFSFSENLLADSRKMEILKLVLALQEPTDIKEKTVFDISEKLQLEYKDLNSEEIVEASHRYIVDQILAEENKKAREEAAATLAAERQKNEAQKYILLEEHRSNLSEVKNQADAEMSLLKAENARLEQKAKDDVLKARADERERYIMQETNRRTKKRIRCYKIITALFAVGFIGVICGTGKWVFSVADATDKIQMEYDYIKYILDFGYAIITGGIIHWGFKDFDKEKVAVSIRKKVEKKYDALQ